VAWPGTASTAPSAAQTWTKISGTITIPAGQYLAQFGIGALQTTPTAAAGYWCVTNVKMRKAVEGSLVVAGSITADKLDANAINGKTINGVTITGTSTITGANIRSAASGSRVELKSNNADGFAIVHFYSTTASDDPGTILVDGASTSRSLSIVPPAASGAANVPIFYQGYTNNGAGTETVITSDNVSIDGLLTTPTIVTGIVNITPSAANTPTSATITGLGPLPGTAHRAYVSANTTVPGTSVLGVSATSVTNDGLTVWLTRANTTTTGVWYTIISS
jgi:hypothetical protein